MEIKQRIIGIIVLIALGIIVVPLIFDSEPQSAVPTDAMLITEASKQKPVKSEVEQENTADTDADEDVHERHLKNKRLKLAVEEDDASAETADVDEAILHKPVVGAARKSKQPLLEADLEATEEIAEPKAEEQAPLDKIETSDAELNPIPRTAHNTSEQNTLAHTERKVVEEKKVAITEHKSTGHKAEHISAEPKADAVTEPEDVDPKPVVKVEHKSKLPTVAEITQPNTKHEVINKDIQREIDEEMADVVSSGWAVQAGVFADRGNANILVKRLQQHGFHAFVKVDNAGKKKIARVYIGPEANRNAADKILKTLHNKLQVSGIVVRYRT